MSKQLKKTVASDVLTENYDATLLAPVEVSGNVKNILDPQLDPAAVATVDRLIKEGAMFEDQLRKHAIGTAVLMCMQGRVFGKAKKVLINYGVENEVMQKVIDDLYIKSGLAPSTMNRRAQMWEEAVYRGIIDLELQLKIDKSPTITSELLSEMEACIGTITGTEFLRQLGVLPPKEKKAKAVKVGKSLKDKLDERCSQVEALLAEIQDEVNSQPADDVLKITLREIVNNLEKAFIGLQKNLIAKVPDLRLGTPSDDAALTAINSIEDLAIV